MASLLPCLPLVRPIEASKLWSWRAQRNEVYVVVMTTMVADGHAVPVSEPAEPEVTERATRRVFSAQYKLRILAEYESRDGGGKSALLRPGRQPRAIPDRTAPTTIPSPRRTSKHSSTDRSSLDGSARSRTARAFCQRFFRWYNHEHRHSGIGFHTPADVHFGRADRPSSSESASCKPPTPRTPNASSASTRPTSSAWTSLDQQTRGGTGDTVITQPTRSHQG